MRPSPLRVLAAACLLFFACKGGSGESTPDASTGQQDGSVTSEFDAGPTTPDAAVAPDAATTGLAALCDALCAQVDTCNGAEPGCQSDCINGIGQASCSEDEQDELGVCATVACDKFEQCMEDVACLGGNDSCGNGSCDLDEDCQSCPTDCGQCVCGDGTCSAGECSTCVADCPQGCACGDVCESGAAQDPSCGACQATVCGIDSFCCQEAWDNICADLAETECGSVCPSICGDGVCDADEDSASCLTDCPKPPACGDATCDPGECSTCAADCPNGCFCADVCAVTTQPQDLSCGTCQDTVCTADPYCCEQEWDSICVNEATELCAAQCPSVCGDFVCATDEDIGSCPADCGTPVPDPLPNPN